MDPVFLQSTEQPCECKRSWNYNCIASGCPYHGCSPEKPGDANPWCYINEKKSEKSGSCTTAMPGWQSDKQWKYCSITDGKVCQRKDGTSENSSCESNNCKVKCCKSTVSNCSECDSLGDCKTCNTNYVKKDGNCELKLTTCAPGKTLNATENVCEDCPAVKNSTFTTENSCTFQCEDNFIEKGRKCAPKLVCPPETTLTCPGKFVMNDKQMCVWKGTGVQSTTTPSPFCKPNTAIVEIAACKSNQKTTQECKGGVACVETDDKNCLCPLGVQVKSASCQDNDTATSFETPKINCQTGYNLTCPDGYRLDTKTNLCHANV